MHEGIMGWDVGGAHLKAAFLAPDDSVLDIIHLPCPLWRGLEHLEQGITQVLARVGRIAPLHAVTMTGELVDLFPNRSMGVRQLVSTVEQQLLAQELWFYGGPRGFLQSRDAVRLADDVASANWMASAQYVARRVEQGLFIDVGSTTTDIVVINHGEVSARGYRDHERLLHEELVYTGVVRTPLMAVTDRVPVGGEWVPVMAEHFATTADVYRLLGALPAKMDQAETADGAPKSLEDSARRLARMVGRDMESMPFASWVRAAAYLQEMQLQRIRTACERVLSRGQFESEPVIVGAGVGRFLVEILATRMGLTYRDFSEFAVVEKDSDWVSACAPAIAVAGLMSQMV
jgi:(4-(4-[2-(gamma-L-glutamylamino)ethyl]phenoxymethyl)furan-2-yl)methanamine synthase